MKLNPTAEIFIAAAREQLQDAEQILRDDCIGKMVVVPHGPYKGRPAKIVEVDVSYGHVTATVEICRKDGNGYISTTGIWAARFYDLEKLEVIE